MRRGGGKEKGGSFERLVATQLSKWVSHGKRDDLYWRSAMSGGRATVAKKKGTDIRQTGDICSVSPEGHILTNIYFIECKFYKNLDIANFFLERRGTLWGFWEQACKQAINHGLKPMLIAKENRRKPLLLCYGLEFSEVQPLADLVQLYADSVHVYDLNTILKSEFRGA